MNLLNAGVELRGPKLVRIYETKPEPAAEGEAPEPPAKYKNTIEPMQIEYAEASLELQPIWYRSSCEADNPEWSWWGFSAEQAAQIDPRLVQWKTHERVVEVFNHLIVDAEGFIWNGHWNGWKLTRYDPDGRIERQIPFPVQHVISFAFGGKDLDELFVTTAWWDLNEEQRKAQPWAGDLLRVHTGVRGLLETAFAEKPALEPLAP